MVEVERGTVSPSPRSIGVKTTQRLGQGDLPEVSSTLIVRLLSHEPISPLSAKRGF